VASAEEAAKLVQQQPVLVQVRIVDEELWVVAKTVERIELVQLEQQAGLTEVGQEVRPDEEPSEA
jgi:hypothetical protein